MALATQKKNKTKKNRRKYQNAKKEADHASSATRKRARATIHSGQCVHSLVGNSLVLSGSSTLTMLLLLGSSILLISLSCDAVELRCDGVANVCFGREWYISFQCNLLITSRAFCAFFFLLRLTGNKLFFKTRCLPTLQRKAISLRRAVSYLRVSACRWASCVPRRCSRRRRRRRCRCRRRRGRPRRLALTLAVRVLSSEDK